MNDQAGSNPSADLFGRGDEYAEMLDRGLRLTGDGKEYYLQGRLELLQGTLPEPFSPSRILDFGCGTGETSVALARAYPTARVTGLDTAAGVIDFARRTHVEPHVEFASDLDRVSEGQFDLCYVNGVFHHIPPISRPRSLKWIRSRLCAGGILALFENNPWNPGTRLVMSRIPFDRDAETLSPPLARKLLEESGFRVETPTRHAFFFPSALRALRRLDRLLRPVPLGGQYLVLGLKE